MNTQPKNRKHWISSLFFTLLLLVTYNSFASDDKGIEFFDGTLAEAQAIAIEQQKPVFVQLSATWCLPCRQMEKYVFPLSSVGSFFNSNFISLKVDADSFDGIELKQDYKILTVPESLFFDSNGHLMLQEGGFKGEQDILTLGNQILKKHPKARTTIKKEKVKKQKKVKKRKVKKTKTSKFSSEEINNLYEEKSSFNLFWLRLSGQIKQPRHMKWVYHNAENFDSKAMDILLRQKSHYAKHYGEAAVNEHIKSILYTKLAIATGDKNEFLFKEILKVAKKAKLPESNFFIVELQSRYYEGIGDDENFVKVNRQFMRNYKGTDPAIYHRKAWDISDHSDDRGDLLKAINWLEKSVELNPQFYNLKSLAEFYDKAGKNRKARKTAALAIEHAKKEGKAYSVLLEIME